jgi:hypothetical protein
MEHRGVVNALNVLLTADPDVVDRDELGELVRNARALRGFLDAADVRLARRARELADAGESESASVVMMDEGRRSGKEAKATQEREQLCDQIPAFEDALAAGAVSGDHLDVVTKLTRNLSDAERSDVNSMSDEIVGMATTEYVSTFERHMRNLINTIREINNAGDDAAELDRQRKISNIRRWTDKATGLHATLIELDPVRDATLWARIDAATANLRQQPGNAKTAYPHLQIEALLRTVSSDSGAGSSVPEVSVLIDLETLTDGPHERSVCETDAGVPLPVSTIRRLCCDADIIPITLGSIGETLDVGRAQRTATRPQRRALRAMYATCAHPHCEVGFDRCRIHHIRWWWEHHGATDLDNLVPLYEKHHHQVHEGRWQLTMTPDRTTTWLRPDGTREHTGPSINRRTERPLKQAS